MALSHLGGSLTGHLVHVVLFGSAIVAFVVLAAREIRAGGRPTFSWRLSAPGRKYARSVGKQGHR